MAKKPKPTVSSTIEADYDILQQVQWHFTMWNQDYDRRRTRPGGWNDVTDAYWGKLPPDWPYTNRVVDPILWTNVNEKDDRILNAKLRGVLVPREGGDQLKSKINNTLLEFQWDNANEGGSMLTKIKQASQDTRLYASKFSLVKWKYECDEDGKVLFNGNEFKPLDIRDSGIDPTADHIRNAKWFQVREWAKLEDLEKMQDTIPDEYGKNEFTLKLSKLKVLNEGYTKSDKRDTRYQDRLLNLKGLPDRVGDDKSFPIVELVTEYRRGRWITFSPRHSIILRDIPNPYRHKKIPIVQLRYRSIQGDPLGESEVERVLGLWRTIQAVLCGFLDSYNIHIRPPLKILDGQVRIETIVFGPEAQMIMNRPDAVTEFQSSGGVIQYFQTAFQSLRAEFNTAMGQISQGVSTVDPLEKGKTATEIKQSAKQQNVTDQANQNSLQEMLQDMMAMWLINNQQFLFENEEMKEYIMRVVGRDNFEYFQRAGMGDDQLTPEAAQAVKDVILMQGGNMSDEDVQQLISAGKTPKFPVVENPGEKNPDKYKIKPKLRISDMGDEAELSMIPDDLEGTYDYVADVQSMSSGAVQDVMRGRQQVLETLQNPQILQQLAAEGKRPKIADLLISVFDGLNLEGDRYIEDIPQQEQQGQMQGQMQGQGQMPGVPGQAGMQQPSDIQNINSLLDQGSQVLSQNGQGQTPIGTNGGPQNSNGAGGSLQQRPF